MSTIAVSKNANEDLSEIGGQRAVQEVGERGARVGISRLSDEFEHLFGNLHRLDGRGFDDLNERDKVGVKDVGAQGVVKFPLPEQGFPPCEFSARHSAK